MAKECLDGKCPKCKLNYRKAYSNRLGPYCEACAKDYAAKNLARKRSFVNDYKLTRGCRICGYTEHPVALELNHIDPLSKTMDIARSLGSCSMERLLAEIEKCDVLCANCHQIHTYENKHHLTRRTKPLQARSN